MTNAGPISKKCPKCKKVDVTTFSTCRDCGTRYDYQAPAAEPTFSFMPIIMIVGVIIIGISAYGYLQIGGLYKRPEQLIGKTLTCNGSMLFVSTEKANLLSLDPADFKLLNHLGVDDGPTNTDASALNHLAGMADQVSIIEKYGNDSRFAMIQKEHTRDPNFSVKVVGASDPSDKYPLVRVELLNGPRAGSSWWIDSSKLDLSLKDK